MKAAALLAVFLAMPCLANAASNQAILQEQYKALGSTAPKGYPTLFVVAASSIQPGAPLGLGPGGGCSMSLETFGKVYWVMASHGMIKDCTSLQPGLVVWAHVHKVLGNSFIDVQFKNDGKTKTRRYVVSGITLVNPSQ